MNLLETDSVSFNQETDRNWGRFRNNRSGIVTMSQMDSYEEEVDENIVLRKYQEAEGKAKRKGGVFRVCLDYCKYDVIHEIFELSGWKRVRDGEKWNLLWTDHVCPAERLAKMKMNQRINHFPLMREITRKDTLTKNINKMKRGAYAEEYNFYPRSWQLPYDYTELRQYCSKSKKTPWLIYKPPNSCQGKGIRILRGCSNLSISNVGVVQEYIKHPLLIDGLKFDLRVYVLVTSVSPLTVYMFRDGLVRLSTVPYAQPSKRNINQLCMHLTNYAVNKHNPNFVQPESYGKTGGGEEEEEEEEGMEDNTATDTKPNQLDKLEAGNKLEGKTQTSKKHLSTPKSSKAKCHNASARTEPRGNNTTGGGRTHNTKVGKRLPTPRKRHKAQGHGRGTRFSDSFQKELGNCSTFSQRNPNDATALSEPSDGAVTSSNEAFHTLARGQTDTECCGSDNSLNDMEFYGVTDQQSEMSSSSSSSSSAEEGFGSSKWDFDMLRSYFKANRLDFDRLWADISAIVVKTLLAIYQHLNYTYNSATHLSTTRQIRKNVRSQCFEILGFDILIEDKGPSPPCSGSADARTSDSCDDDDDDDDSELTERHAISPNDIAASSVVSPLTATTTTASILNGDREGRSFHSLTPYLLEVNHTPSFRCDTVLDEKVKRRLIAGTLCIIMQQFCCKNAPFAARDDTVKQTKKDNVRNKRLITRLVRDNISQYREGWEEEGRSMYDFTDLFDLAYPTTVGPKPPKIANKVDFQISAVDYSCATHNRPSGLNDNQRNPFFHLIPDCLKPFASVPPSNQAGSYSSSTSPLQSINPNGNDTITDTSHGLASGTGGVPACPNKRNSSNRVRPSLNSTSIWNQQRKPPLPTQQTQQVNAQPTETKIRRQESLPTIEDPNNKQHQLAPPKASSCSKSIPYRARNNSAPGQNGMKSMGGGSQAKQRNPWNVFEDYLNMYEIGDSCVASANRVPALTSLYEKGGFEQFQRVGIRVLSVSDASVLMPHGLPKSVAYKFHEQVKYYCASNISAAKVNSALITSGDNTQSTQPYHQYTGPTNSPYSIMANCQRHYQNSQSSLYHNTSNFFDAASAKIMTPVILKQKLLKLMVTDNVTRNDPVQMRTEGQNIVFPTGVAFGPKLIRTYEGDTQVKQPQKPSNYHVAAQQRGPTDLRSLKCISTNLSSGGIAVANITTLRTKVDVTSVGGGNNGLLVGKQSPRINTNFINNLEINKSIQQVLQSAKMRPAVHNNRLKPLAQISVVQRQPQQPHVQQNQRGDNEEQQQVGTGWLGEGPLTIPTLDHVPLVSNNNNNDNKLCPTTDADLLPVSLPVPPPLTAQASRRSARRSNVQINFVSMSPQSRAASLCSNAAQKAPRSQDGRASQSRGSGTPLNNVRPKTDVGGHSY